MPSRNFSFALSLPLLALALTAFSSSAALSQTAAATASVPASVSALPAALSASGAPPVLTLADLAAPGQSWYRFHLVENGEGNARSIYASIFSSAVGQGAQDDHYYTQGRQITIAGQASLIAYTLASSLSDPAALLREERDSSNQPPPPLTAASKLTLVFLNLQAIPGMADIEPFDLQATLKESQTRYRQAKAAIAQVTAQATSATAESNAKQVMLGMIQYEQDYDEKMPPLGSAAALKKAIYPYVKSEADFLDPATNAPFAYNAAYSRLPLAKFDNPAASVVLYSRQPDSSGMRVVGFVDGHVKKVSESQWQSMKAASHIK